MVTADPKNKQNLHYDELVDQDDQGHIGYLELLLLRPCQYRFNMAIFHVKNHHWLINIAMEPVIVRHNLHKLHSSRCCYRRLRPTPSLNISPRERRQWQRSRWHPDMEVNTMWI